MKIIAAFGMSLALTAGAAQAQTPQPRPAAGPTGSTISGGLPEKSVSSVGQTKPPGEAAPGTNAELERKSRALDRKIDKGICVGCK